MLHMAMPMGPVRRGGRPLVRNRIALCLALLVAGLGTSADASERPGAHDDVVTFDDLTLVSSTATSDTVVDERSGDTHRVEGHTYVYRLPTTSFADQAAGRVCEYIFTVNSPSKAGGPSVRYAVSGGNLEVTADCGSSLFATYELSMDESPGGYVLKDSQSNTVNPGQSRPFYVSKDCVSESFIESWRARFQQGGGPEFGTFFCSA